MPAGATWLLLNKYVATMHFFAVYGTTIKNVIQEKQVLAVYEVVSGRSSQSQLRAVR